ncbi:MAG: GFA family protein [Geminicoccaceae bacterium]
MTLEGGCLCGAVRYRVEGTPLDAGYCHCRVCQRSAGAPVLAWFTVTSQAFGWSSPPPATFRSSAHGSREFCSKCGTQLLFKEDGVDLVDVNLATLDDPTLVRPDYHIWTQSRIPWFEIADDLPRHPDGGPDRELSQRHRGGP